MGETGVTMCREAKIVGLKCGDPRDHEIPQVIWNFFLPGGIKKIVKGCIAQVDIPDE
jgi:hypothetical protein